jgi:hypothetical protein
MKSEWVPRRTERRETSCCPGPAEHPHPLMQPIRFPLERVVKPPEEISRYRMVSPLGANCPASGLDGNGSHRSKQGQLAARWELQTLPWKQAAQDRALNARGEKRLYVT